MADKMIFQKKWYDAIKEDEYIETTEQEMAYILYAAMIYSFEGERIDIGEVFGKEFKGLNRSMPNIYSQIDNIVGWSDKMSDSKRKYDPDRIRELRLQGYKAREICEIEGYDVSKANNITSNRGWKEAGEILKEQKNPENTEFVQNLEKSGNSVKNLENLGVSGFVF